MIAECALKTWTCPARKGLEYRPLPQTVAGASPPFSQGRAGAAVCCVGRLNRKR